MAEQAKENFRALPVLHAGGPDVDAQKQPLGVGQEVAFVAFAAFDFFARIVAAAAGSDGVGTFDTLAVDDGSAGLRVFLASGAGRA